MAERTQFKIYLGEEELWDLDDWCEKNGMNRSAGVRHILKKFIELDAKMEAQREALAVPVEPATPLSA